MDSEKDVASVPAADKVTPSQTNGEEEKPATERPVKSTKEPVKSKDGAVGTDLEKQHKDAVAMLTRREAELRKAIKGEDPGALHTVIACEELVHSAFADYEAVERRNPKLTKRAEAALERRRDAYWGLVERTKRWVATAKGQLLEKQEGKHGRTVDFAHEDGQRKQDKTDGLAKSTRSVSSHGSSSTTSSATSAAAALVRERAKFAALQVERDHQSDLMKQEIALKQQQLELKLRKSQAKQDVFVSFLSVDSPLKPQVTSTSKSCNDVKCKDVKPLHAGEFTQSSNPVASPVRKLDPNAKPFAMVTKVDSPTSDSPDDNPTPDQVHVTENPIYEVPDLITALALPKVEIVPFDGDVMAYQSFISAFDFRVGNRPISDNDKLHYLHQQCAGEARDLISSCFYMGNGYKEARRLLEQAYGDEYSLTAAYVAKLSSWAVMKGDDPKELRKLACFLTRCLGAMRSVKYSDLLDHPETLRSVVQKLPRYLQNRWSEKAYDIINRRSKVRMADLEEFVRRASEVSNNPMFGKTSTKSGNHFEGTQHKVQSSQRTVNSFSVQTNKSADQACFACGEKGHLVHSCKALLGLTTIEAKREFLKGKGLCYACLGQGHMSRVCKKRAKCDVCNRNHPTAMHVSSVDKRSDRSDQNESAARPSSSNAETLSNCAVSVMRKPSTCSGIFHPILPVMVRQKGSDRQALTYCFLDNGSSGCFITKALFHDLEMNGRDGYLQLNTIQGPSYESSVIVEDLVLSDHKGHNPVEIPKVFVKDMIPVDRECLARAELCSNVPSLRDFVDLLPPHFPDVGVGMLLGCNSVLLKPLSIKCDSSSSIYAVQYKHGWTVQGSFGNAVSSDLACRRIVAMETSKEALLPNQILKLLEGDFSDSRLHPDERGTSPDDRRFMEIVTQQTKFVAGHFEVPLPLKDRQTVLLSNRAQALSRLSWQEKKMRANESYRNDYVNFMTNLMEKGYCERVPRNSSEETSNVWYLPHHGVYHPQKGKLRIVFDCSAKFNGACLNDFLLQGPNLANNLCGVLMRFRFDRIAFVADLEAMFYQVQVPEADRRYLRFLWWENSRLGAKIEEFQMKVHIFGATSSPSVANYAIRKIASAAENEEVKQTLQRHFYVDDCLRSVGDASDGVRLITHLTAELQQNGFHLTKFNSNCRDVLAAIPENERAKEVNNLNLDFDNLPVTRALGVLWDIENDSFSFEVKVKDRPMSRRGVLATTAAVYDPLGFVAPVVLKAKRLLQELCVDDIGWDEHLTDAHQREWNAWLADLQSIRELHIPRQFFACMPIFPSNAHLHVFCDASRYAYGAVAYLRVEFSGQVKLAFVAGKARVAPIKLKSIQTTPKLELSAATLAVRLSCLVLREMGLQLPTTYHTDSEIVISYIRSDDRRFPVFVANRVQIIREFSNPNQWRYVPSEFNPADHVSRGLSATEIVNSSWLQGPEFLLKAEEYWPPQTSMQHASEYAEASRSPVRSCAIRTHLEASEPESPTDRLIAYYSSWSKLRRAIVHFRKFGTWLRNSRSSDRNTDHVHVITESDLRDAERAVLVRVQKKAFSREIGLLSSDSNADGHGKRVLRGSRLYHLNPFMGEDGLLRVGGRLRRSALSFNERHPIILPSTHSVTELIIRHEHVKLGHAGRNHVLFGVRSKFWIIHGNASVRRVLANCVPCKRGRGKCLNQIMADLPQCRVDGDHPPFSFVGVDCFGPFDVKRGRRTEKHYGILFTCMASRAIHLELSPGLDTNSFICALRRFVARRGPVTDMFCDNGTNFVGARNDFLKAMAEMDREKVRKFAESSNISWHFNPPLASHMGGAWERAIGSVRKVLFGLMQEASFSVDFETLHTLFCEVESIVNSRPLTAVSSDPNDPIPLSPNQILTLKTQWNSPPPGSFESSDVYCRRRWRRVQYLADVFWSRWRKEFLALLQNRSKWQTSQRNLAVGDIVIQKDDSVPRNLWPLCIVEAVEMDDQNLVRSVTIRSEGKSLRRPIHKLIFLCSSD